MGMSQKKLKEIGLMILEVISGTRRILGSIGIVFAYVGFAALADNFSIMFLALLYLVSIVADNYLSMRRINQERKYWEKEYEKKIKKAS